MNGNCTTELLTRPDRPSEEPTHIISLGAGVQSSTMALMAAAGEIEPLPVAAIFADTQSEPSSVYRWLDWLEQRLPFPVHRVTAGNLAADTLKIMAPKEGGPGYIRNTIPAFTVGQRGEPGMLLRKCTRDYKIDPIRRCARQIMREAGARRVVQWIGISMDEVQRMRPSGVKYVENRYPLIDLRMSRSQCLEWMSKHGYPEPPRSACTFCPYHSDRQWQRIKIEEPEEFAKAVAFERDWQAAVEADRGPSQLRGKLFLHRSRVPLDQAFFVDDRQIEMFNDECGGVCGV